ncbi:MAG: fused response regulator/phosphatase [Brevinematales bacterium]|nr:fused response regulator/phosphatase [Brevinematales bacterium]
MKELEKFYDKMIYVVDDSPVIRTLITNCLIEEGFKNVIMCENGKDAIEKIKQNKTIDMVITDYDMPEMNGEELVDNLRNSYGNDVIIIVLSAQTSKQKIVEMMRKADDYIIKDEIDLIKSDIFFVIRKCFENYEIRKENEKLLAELKERDKRIKIELETARVLLSEFKEITDVKSSVFRLSYYNKMSNMIGGDFFTIRRLTDNKIGVLMGDISGHGIPAALLMLVFKNAVLEAMENNKNENFPTCSTMKEINSKLSRLFPESKYATISYLILDENEKSVTYTNEFQNPILLIKDDGEITEIDNGKYKLIGIYTEEMLGKTIEFNCDRFIMNNGERLILFTDGIIEARNPETDEEYGIERVKNLIKKHHKQQLTNLLKIILQDFYNFTKQKVSDDVTIFGLELC